MVQPRGVVSSTKEHFMVWERWRRVASVLACSALGSACLGESEGVESARLEVGELRAPLRAADGRRDHGGGEAGAPVAIAMRSFSANPSVGGSATSVSDADSPNYGAVSVFMEKAAAYTD